MVDKEGKEGEAEAQKAYKAARKANEEGTERDAVTSALIDRVTQCSSSGFGSRLLLQVAWVYLCFIILNVS